VIAETQNFFFAGKESAAASDGTQGASEVHAEIEQNQIRGDGMRCAAPG
jgi:hypothetical protein